MTWFDSSANQAEAEKPHIRMFIAVDLEFSSAHVRVWSGSGDITISGHVFTGLGAMGKVSTPAENNRLIAEKKTYQLTGVDPSLVSEADIDASFGRDVTEYVGFLDTVTGQLVDTPEITWEGRIDQINRTDGRNPVIEINAETRTVLLDQTDGWRYTDEHQKLFFPADDGFDQVAPSSLKTLYWGGKKVVIGTPVYGGGDDWQFG